MPAARNHPGTDTELYGQTVRQRRGHQGIVIRPEHHRSVDVVGKTGDVLPHPDEVIQFR